MNHIKTPKIEFEEFIDKKLIDIFKNKIKKMVSNINIIVYPGMDHPINQDVRPNYKRYAHISIYFLI